jgi:hypothetical protein
VAAHWCGGAQPCQQVGHAGSQRSLDNTGSGFAQLAADPFQSRVEFRSLHLLYFVLTNKGLAFAVSNALDGHRFPAIL